MTSYPVIIITLILAFIPVSAILSAAWAFYDWLISRLPKNIQTVLIAHQAQVRSIITSVVDAVEQKMQGETGEDKKAEAVAMAENIFNNLPLPKSIPPPSPELVDALIEQAVAYLPHTSTPAPLPVEAAKATDISNPFYVPAIDPTPTKPLASVSVTGIPPVVAYNPGTAITIPNGAVSPPLAPVLDPPPIIADAL